MIGVILPPSAGGALANLGLTIAGKAPVNLNFTAGGDALASAIEQCGIRTILTSKAFLAKTGVEERAGMVFLEDVLASAGAIAKVWAMLKARLAPAWAISEKSIARPAGYGDFFERQHRRAQGRDAFAL